MSPDFKSNTMEYLVPRGWTHARKISCRSPPWLRRTARASGPACAVHNRTRDIGLRDRRTASRPSRGSSRTRRSCPQREFSRTRTREPVVLIDPRGVGQHHRILLITQPIDQPIPVVSRFHRHFLQPPLVRRQHLQPAFNSHATFLCCSRLPCMSTRPIIALLLCRSIPAITFVAVSFRFVASFIYVCCVTNPQLGRATITGRRPAPSTRA